MSKNIDLTKKKNLLKLKESLTSVIDAKINSIDNTEALKRVKNLSLNGMRYLFEHFASDFYATNEGKKVIKEYINIFKSSKEGKAIYSIYESISKPSGISDPKLYVDYVTVVMEGINRKKANNIKRNLGKILCEGLNSIGVGAEKINSIIDNYESSNVYRSLDYVYENKMSYENLKHYTNSISVLSEHIMNANKDLNESTEVDTKKSMENLNELFSTDLEPWQKRVIEDIVLVTTAGDGKDKLFEAYKEKCIEIIDEAINSEECTNSIELTGIKEKLLERQYNEETINEDLLKLGELIDTLS